MAETLNSEGENRFQRMRAIIRKCPIRVAMGVLGKKWTLLILRDIAFYDINRFNQFRRSIPGLTPRVLTLRLHELENCGLIQAVIIRDNPRLVEWTLTEKGKDTIPILVSIITFGAKWYPDEVFQDGRPRSLAEIFTTEKR